MRISALVASALLTFSGLTFGQVAYPTKPVRLIVPFPAGGTNDVVGRILAQQLSTQMGQQFVVDNRTGAGGIIGTETVARAAPDGYTLLLASGPFTSTPALHKSLSYDVSRDFVGIAGLSVSPALLVRNPSTPYKTLRELLDHAKSRPESVRYGSGGTGSTPHLGAALLESIAGVRFTHVPYRGGAPSMTAVAAGEVDIVVNSMTTLLPMIEQGRIVPVVICQAQRSPRLPQVPSVVEAQLPRFIYNHWLGLVAPSKTPATIQQRLDSEIRKALTNPEVKARLSALGSEVYGGSRQEFQKFMQDELQQWAKLVREGRIAPQ